MSSISRLNDPKYLKGYWPLNSNADDLSGLGNNGTWSGTEAYADGPFGRSVGNFNGSNAYVAVSPPSDWFGAGNKSMSLWMNIDATPVAAIDVAILFGTRTQFQSFGFHIQTNDVIYFSGYAADINTGVATVPGQWDHLVATYNGTDVNVYRNGEWIAGNTQTSNVQDNSLNIIGAGNDGAISGKFPGDIKDVRIYNVALTGDECRALYLSER